MIASVILVGRLPRSLGVFDYLVPAELETGIHAGQLVSVPFRSSTRFGIVKSERAGTDARLKMLDSVVSTEPFLLSAQMTMIDSLATWYGVSPAAIAAMMLPPLQKRKFRNISMAEQTSIRRKKISQPIFHLYRSEQEHADCLREALFGTTLLLVPTRAILESVKKLLSPHVRDSALFWHSDMTPKEQFAGWFAVRNGEKRIVAGLRSALFLPFPRLDRIVIDYEHDENHKSWDGAPRYHAKDVAELLADLSGATLHCMSFSPSVENYFHIFSGRLALSRRKKQITKPEQLLSPIRERPEIVDMRDERKKKNFSLFADRSVDAIQSASGDIFLFLNRVGFATSVGCNDCGYIARCPSCQLPFIYHEEKRMLACHHCRTQTPLPLSCPVCASPVVQLRGAGTESAEKEIRRILGVQNPRAIVRIDRESEGGMPDTEKSRIIIGTDMALPHIRWDKTDCIVFLDFDKQLAIPEYMSTERAWHRIAEVQYKRSSDSRFFIQTFHPEHMLFRSLSEPDRFYRTELSGRKAFGYPPYAYLVRYIHDARDAFALTDGSLSSILTPPVETHPKYSRGIYWQTRMARLSADAWQEELPMLNARVPQTWKIDPHPISLLAP